MRLSQYVDGSSVPECLPETEQLRGNAPVAYTVSQRENVPDHATRATPGPARSEPGHRIGLGDKFSRSPSMHRPVRCCAVLTVMASIGGVIDLQGGVLEPELVMEQRFDAGADRVTIGALGDKNMRR